MRYVQQQLAGYPGAHVVYAVDDNLPAPLGFIWFRYPMWRVVELLYVFTHEDHRRKGVATSLLGYIKEAHPLATIGGAQVNGLSVDWCKKHGFMETNNGWFLIPKEI